MSSDDGDRWDFYACHIEDAPASILLNFRFEHEPMPPEATTLYRMRIQMLEPDEHGMGDAIENAAFNALEQQLGERAADADFYYVGRIRSAGVWEVVFYGPPERKAALQAMREAITDRRTYLDVRPDPDWGYYREFLLPDEERRQWMENRRLVDVLREHGDALTPPRPVEHYVDFATAEGRDAFIARAKALGFELEGTSEDERDHPFGVAMTREDPVELGHIHDVVMQLVALADEHGGDYDGWETPIVVEFKPPSN